MKKLTCRDLGGPCDTEIVGDSFEEIGRKSHEHVMEQINNRDEAHKTSALKMKNSTPEEQRALMAEFEIKYNDAPEV